MRTIEEIKADMEEAIEKYDTDRMNDLYKEEALCYIRDIQVDRLEQICQAEREGLLVVLPCKVGTTLYHIGCISCEDCPKRNNRPLSDCFKDLYGEPIILDDCEEDCIDVVREYPYKFDVDLINDIGKTVFLDNAQAEAALAGMEGNE